MSAPSEQCENEKKHSDYVWLIRPCEMYYEEYSDCVSMRGQFYQRYQGEVADCLKWKEDHKNCLKYRNHPSAEVASKIIENELERQANRLRDAKGNDIWTYRTSPPAEWTRPLPGWGENHKDSLLFRAEEAKEKGVTLSPVNVSSCVIL